MSSERGHFPIMDQLYNSRICKVRKRRGVRKDGIQRFTVSESCDNYFQVMLTADQLRQWGEELIALSQTGKERG